MTPQAALSSRAIVTEVTGGRDSGSALGSYLSDQEVKVQLERSLLDNGLLGEAEAEYRITAKILDIETDRGLFRLTVRCTIRYRISKANGIEVLNDTIATNNTARTATRKSLHQAIGLIGSPWAIFQNHGRLEETIASQPMRQGMNASLQANIESFITKLRSILADQP